MIGIKARQTKGFQQRFEPQENLVLTTPKHIRQDGTRVVIDGMPEPAWIAFVLTGVYKNFLFLLAPVLLSPENR